MTPSHPLLIDGLGTVADRYDAFILDIWGVLHDGITLFPGTLECLGQLKRSGKSVCLLSNTPSRGAEIVKNLEDKGLGRDLYTAIVTAGDSAHEDLRTRQGQACWFAGDANFLPLTDGLDLNLLPHHDGADFIVNAISDRWGRGHDHTLSLLREAQSKNLPMLCANPDKVVDVGDQRHICAGTYALYYEELGGHVTWHGKPYAPVYEAAWEKLGRPEKSRMAAIGDSLHTDIQGANTFGIDGFLNMAGIHRTDIERDGTLDIGRLDNLLNGQPHKPAGVLKNFAWDERPVPTAHASNRLAF